MLEHTLISIEYPLATISRVKKRVCSFIPPPGRVCTRGRVSTRGRVCTRGVPASV